MGANLTSKTMHGLKWSYLSTIVKSVIQIGFTAIMARLLEPTAFGLIAMAGIILGFGSYIAQMGVGPALIQKKKIFDEDVRAAFTSALFLGIFFFVLFWFLAPIVIYLFDNKKVIPIIRVMALSFIITGLNITALSLLRRNLEFRFLAIAEITSYLLGYGIFGITLAYNGFGVWSLVAGALSQSALLTILSHLFCRHKLSFILQWKYYKPLYSFGGRISVISFFEFLGSYLDTLAIGHFMGAAPLGIYNRAFMLVNLPAQYLTSSFSRVLFPSLSRIQKETERLKKAYLYTIMLFSAILLPTCFGIAASSQEIVLLLLGEKWIPAIPVLQILAIATPFNLLSHFGGVVCEATATINIKLFMQIVYIVILGVFFFLLSGYGIIGFATAVVIGEFVRFVAYILITGRICRIMPAELSQAYLPSIISSLIIGPLIYFIAIFLREYNTPILLSFIVELMVGFILLIVLFLCNPQKVLREEILNRFKITGIINSRNIRTNKMIYWFYKALSVNL
jgi:O-antigen/teichoic acid export membrane protein